MSFGRKLVSGFTLAISIGVLTTISIAQDAPRPDRPDRPDRPGAMRGERKQGMRGGGKMRGNQRGMRRMRGNMARRGGMGMQFRDLNLSDSQKLQVQKLMETQRANGKSKSEEMRKLMMAQRSGLLT
ncbi:MAG: hypothetical protein KDB79_15855, partial [Acidobacteria bacterium]|nr:hypothetical protein [Acidobacteriota bacterium]